MVSASVSATKESGRNVLSVRSLRLLGLIILWSLWELAAHSGLFFERVVPSSFVILRSVLRLLTEGSFYIHFAVTAFEIVSALAIGAAGGLAVGVLIGYSRFLSLAFEPIIYYLAPTPKIVLLPILMNVFGVDAASKIAVGALSAFFPIVISTVSGMREVAKVHLEVGRSFGLGVWQMVWRIYLPSIRSHVVTGIRLGLGLSVIGVLLAETKLSNRGLGYLAIQYYNTFRIADLYAVLLVVFAATAIVNEALERAEGRRGGA